MLVGSLAQRKGLAPDHYVAGDLLDGREDTLQPYFWRGSNNGSIVSAIGYLLIDMLLKASGGQVCTSTVTFG